MCFIPPKKKPDILAIINKYVKTNPTWLEVTGLYYDNSKIEIYVN